MHICVYKACSKKTELSKQRANQHRGRATATERTQRQVLTTNFHWPRFSMSISRRATSAELSIRINRRTACARAQFSGCSSKTNTHRETEQMEVCCQNLPLGALSSRSAPSVLVGELFKKFGLFLNTGIQYKLWNVPPGLNVLNTIIT